MVALVAFEASHGGDERLGRGWSGRGRDRGQIGTGGNHDEFFSGYAQTIAKQRQLEVSQRDQPVRAGEQRSQHGPLGPANPVTQ